MCLLQPHHHSPLFLILYHLLMEYSNIATPPPSSYRISIIIVSPNAVGVYPMIAKNVSHLFDRDR